jgi:hypothetical protein
MQSANINQYDCQFGKIRFVYTNYDLTYIDKINVTASVV